MSALRVLMGERGAAPVEAVFAIVFVMMMALGVIQVAFTLYARNVVDSSAHEGARAGIESGRSLDEAEAMAAEVVRNGAGGLVDDLQVTSDIWISGDDEVLRIRVTGRLRSFGIVPFEASFDRTATASRAVGAGS
jgi:hypothetical protein